MRSFLLSRQRDVPAHEVESRRSPCHDAEAVTIAVMLGEPFDPFVVCDQRTGKLDGRRNQEPVRRITLRQRMQAIASRRSAMAKRYCFDAWSIEKPLDPDVDRDVERDPPQINQQRDLPNTHWAEQNRPSLQPTTVDQRASRGMQADIPAVEPKDDVGIEQQPLRHRAISAPVSASGRTSRAGAVKSTPSLTRTDP